ncbi:D-2-hydroxyacid dehydrogenase [Paenibacillus sp. B2(2019)]|uniref:D-2-hydroxyacid dehydrogenase n=1 Tax=Paenibacillus sp. B2(2019) TaxID=2607754 RepID=UPI0011F32189|nr:D-2-hydroxyacid dehydrogenase [Paenibacillus sp. B2(2019)]KAA1191311.1 D-2-hydroxyacid dehydrogenase [Paenibacillus sp. B2(2019)]
MKIVVLDGFALNPGDLSWEGLTQLGDVKIYDRTQNEEIVERSLGAQIVLTNKTPLRANVLQQLPELRYIGVLATGYNIIDVQQAILNKIIVTHIPSYGTSSVAQFVFALILELCHHVGRHSTLVHQGEWSTSPDWCFWRSPLIELSGKTMGILGAGRIGMHTARIAGAMGMKVIAANSKVKQSLQVPFDGFRWVSQDELFRSSDIISLHCPLMESTEKIINSAQIRLMKSNVILINTARGELVEENDLAQALSEKRIAGAALDVLSTEPPEADNPLLHAPNCVITPHIAWASVEARTRLLQTAIDNVASFLEGKPQNLVNNNEHQIG